MVRFAIAAARMLKRLACEPRPFLSRRFERLPNCFPTRGFLNSRTSTWVALMHQGKFFGCRSTVEQKRVFELLGEYAGVPKSVRDIGQAIDDAAGTRDWVGSPSDNPPAGDWEPCFKLAREETTAPAPAPL